MDTLQHQMLSLISADLDHSVKIAICVYIYIWAYLTCNWCNFIFVLDCGDPNFYNKQDSSLPLQTDSSIGMLLTLLY
jgi:hypothetical protein